MIIWIDKTNTYTEYTHWVHILNAYTEDTLWWHKMNAHTEYRKWIHLTNAHTEYIKWIHLTNAHIEYTISESMSTQCDTLRIPNSEYVIAKVVDMQIRIKPNLLNT